MKHCPNCKNRPSGAADDSFCSSCGHALILVAQDSWLPITLIVIIFLLIYFLFFAVSASNWLIGLAGTAAFLLPYLLIVFTPLKSFFIRLSHRREPTNHKAFDALLVATSFYGIAMRITARIATLVMLFLRVLVAFIVGSATMRWDFAFVAIYWSTRPLKIFMVLLSPVKTLLEYVARKINFQTVTKYLDTTAPIPVTKEEAWGDVFAKVLPKTKKKRN
ncbi:MAG: hypothetical protein FWB76_05665 [Oscillospiraceae bacterium]|nr:hypothetical protein [Oscillospiraceae bacterium]